MGGFDFSLVFPLGSIRIEVIIGNFEADSSRLSFFLDSCLSAIYCGHFEGIDWRKLWAGFEPIGL
jgi:hypothetical protein